MHVPVRCVWELHLGGIITTIICSLILPVAPRPAPQQVILTNAPQRTHETRVRERRFMGPQMYPLYAGLCPEKHVRAMPTSNVPNRSKTAQRAGGGIGAVH